MEAAPLGSRRLFSIWQPCEPSAILQVMRPARLFLPGFLCDSAYRPATMELGIAVVATLSGGPDQASRAIQDG